MKTCTSAALLVLGLWATAAHAASVSLEQIALADGRVLREVTVKSFDPASGKFHLIADGKAQLVSGQLLPPALFADLQKKVQPAGATTNIVKSTPAMSEAERAKILSHRASAAERYAQELANPVVVAPPAPPPAPATTSVVYPYYPARPVYFSGYNPSYYDWKNCVEKRRDEDYRRRTTPTTITPPLPINALPSGPVNAGINSTR